MRRTNHRKIRLVTHYNLSNSNFDQILQEHTGLLLMNRKEGIKPEDIQVTYSRSPNLKDILIKGTLEDKQLLRGTWPCEKTRCKTCDHIQSGNKIIKEHETYDIRGSFTFQSRNVVYLLKCSICNKKYIGETEQTLNGRCRGHESNMRSNNDNIVSKHYKEYNHTSEHYVVTVIDREIRLQQKIKTRRSLENLTRFHVPKRAK